MIIRGNYFFSNWKDAFFDPASIILWKNCIQTSPNLGWQICSLQVTSRHTCACVHICAKLLQSYPTLSMEFSRQEYWSELPFPSPGDLSNPGSNPGLPHCRQSLYHLSHQRNPSLWHYGPQPVRLLCPLDSPGKNAGVGCHALLQGIFLTQWSNKPSLHTQPHGSSRTSWSSLDTALRNI